MRQSWLELVDVVLRPARPHLERCLRARDEHVASRGVAAEARARAIASCEQRIDSARAAVFAANDGIVSSRMTDLEREWRTLSRPDPDGGLMDLWARVAPPSWIDRKHWRDQTAAGRLDAAIALASDIDGIEAAEAAIDALRGALAPWAARIGSRTRWRIFDEDTDAVTSLLAEPLRAARETVAVRDAEPVVLDRAEELRRAVEERAGARFPQRPLLARSLGHAALVDFIWRAGSLAERPNPVTPLFSLWKAGYGLAAIDPSGVTVELPPI